MPTDPPRPRPRSAEKPRFAAAIVLAAGKGTRLPGSRPKVLVDCLGVPILEHVRRALAPLKLETVLLVVGHGRDEVTAWAAKEWPDAKPVVQEPQNGTGHAVRVALETVSDLEGDVLVLCGDVPQIETEDLRTLLSEHRESGAVASVLVGHLDNPGSLGRILRKKDRSLDRIVEAKDATKAELAVQEFNTGVYAVDAGRLWWSVTSLSKKNAQGEEYLTDAMTALAAESQVDLLPARDAEALLGVNTPDDLARAFERLRRREVALHLKNGVQVVDPLRTVIETGVTIAPGARILPFSYVAHGCHVGAECVVGPFAHLRGGTVLMKGAQVGNFVEVKATVMHEGAKAKHLTYLGDADVGAGANVGCGTITANFDGVAKHKTKIGKGARIGSGTVLVAPVAVGEGAVTGAGAIVLAGKDVPAGTTAVGVPAPVVAKAAAGPAASPAAGTAPAAESAAAVAEAGGRGPKTPRKGRAR